jgi:hypothetical protein
MVVVVDLRVMLWEVTTAYTKELMAVTVELV